MHLYSGTFSKGSALDFKVHFLRIIDFQGHVLGRQQGEWEERGGKKGQESKAIPRTISGVRRGEKRWKFYSDVTRICRLVLVFFCCVKDFFTFSRLARMIFKITAKLFLVKIQLQVFQDQSYPLSNFSVTSKVAEKVGESQGGARGETFSRDFRWHEKWKRQKHPENLLIPS